jgi:GT2 family glycosyltransferase
MKLYGMASKKRVPEQSKHTNAPASPVLVQEVSLPHVQTVPVTISVPNAKTVQQIKVDVVNVIGSKTVIMGWSTADIELFVQSGEKLLDVERIRIKRPDVAAHLAISDEETGFILIISETSPLELKLFWNCPHNKKKQTFELKCPAGAPLDTGVLQMLIPAFPSLLEGVRPFTAEWYQVISMLPKPSQNDSGRAHMEQALSCSRTNEGVFVGWLLQKDITAPVWVEDEDGNLSPLKGVYRSYRQDVAEAFGIQFGPSECAGMVANVSGLKPEKRWQLKMLCSDGVHVLAETSAGVLPSDPVACARRLFSLNVNLNEFHNRIGAIDEPILEKLIKLQRAAQDVLPVKQRQLGQTPESPLVSVIIPLYGRVDFIEHQLMEFCEDEWLKKHVELIYVVDDPALVDSFASKIESLYRVYQIPVRWVWGSANRGFSGANNLGVACAKGEYLTFLNSDAFPQKTGWIEQLIDVLRLHPKIGVVGPRLVTADGAIQHAGMTFLRREDLGIWTNHHPYMGLDPSLDPAKELTIVPAVTGACMVMRRQDFETIGGWDTGYLIGDFEDSDLCLKLRSAGFDIAYCPSVQLTHLERQSFKLLGNDEMRTRVVIYNAVRHQNKWQALLASSNVVSSI